MAETGSKPTTDYADFRLDGARLAAMFTAAADALQRTTELINALNVFPVPDGDTGTNMFLTMQDGVKNLSALASPTASEVAAALYSGTFMGARGNSGVILSQFFKGFEEGLDGKVDCGSEDFARACGLARKHAYKSVAEPVEGTMLTVIASVADAVRETAGRESDVAAVLRIASDRARDTVARTTEMLPVLREAGVVDAGGQGLAVILEGMRRSAAGEDIDETAFDIQVPDATPLGSGTVSSEFFSAHENDVYGYCTQFTVEADGMLDVDDLRVRINDIAESTVVIGDGSRAMIHAHAEDPGLLLSLGVSVGALSKVKIENMDAQHADFASDQREAAVPEGTAPVVVVAWGDGFSDIFFRDYEVAPTVTGGNTMNPSVRDLMDAIDRAPANAVYVLPNNKNIIPAAKQAAKQSQKTVFVVETLSIPQGIAALDYFDPEADADRNVRNMEEARNAVTTGEITRAVRDATTEGVEVREGQLIGLLDGRLRVAGDELDRVLIDLVGEADVGPGGMVALYWGAMLSAADAESAAETLRNVYGDLEVQVYRGGQPHYEFLISIE